MIREEIRVPHILHFSPGVPFPSQPATPQEAMISPFARISTGVTAPQSGHFPERAGEAVFWSTLADFVGLTCLAL